jgi:hypothetical protein
VRFFSAVIRHEPYPIWSPGEMKAPEFYLRNMERSRFLLPIKKEKGNVNPIHLQSLSLVLHVIEEVVMISNDYKVQGLGVVE